MATWTIRIPARDISITTAQLEAVEAWIENLSDRGGPGASGDILRERVLMEKYLIEEQLDAILAWELGERGPDPKWRVGGGVVVPKFIASGQTQDDGQVSGTAIFRDLSGPFTLASDPVGKIIRITPAQSVRTNANRGNYLIIDRINNQRVEVEGVFPVEQTQLDWEYRVFGITDALAILVAP